MALVTIPPILSCVVISLSALRRPFLARWVLPSLAVLAAMRINGLVQTYSCAEAHHTPNDEPIPRTLLPIS